MADLYARIVLRLIGPALALRERGLAERLEGLSKAAQGPCVNAVADELLKSAGFGDPMPPKNGGDAEAEGAAQPHKPIPPSPCGSVAALYEAMQQGAADAVAATQRAEEARSKQNAQWDVVREVLGAPISPVSDQSSDPVESSSSETPSGSCAGCSRVAPAAVQPVALPSERLDRVAASTRTTPGAAS